MKKSLILLIFILIFGYSSKGQTEPVKSDGRIRPHIPTVYLAYMCQDEKSVFLRLINNTSWHIEIRSGLYWPTKKPVTLRNGVETYAVPSDGPITSIYYQVEVDELANISSAKIPKNARGGVGNDGGGAWVAPGDSIFFPVPNEFIRNGLKITMNFRYEWEIRRDGTSINEPEHRVYFRGSDIGSANTGIKPTLCQK